MRKKARQSTFDMLPSIREDASGFEDVLQAEEESLTSWGGIAAGLSRMSNAQIAVALTISLCMALSMIYAGFAYAWLWLGVEHPVGDEPIAMSGIVEETSAETAGLSRGALPFSADAARSGKDPSAESKAEGKHYDFTKKLLSADAPLLMLGMKESLGNIEDPFAPLIRPVEAGMPALPPEEVDILADVEYAGFIGDVKAKDKVAIIRTVEGTMVKKTGESFSLSGEKVWVSEIAPQYIRLKVQGQKRTLPLAPYLDDAAQAPSGNSNATSVAAAPAGGGASGGIVNLPATPPSTGTSGQTDLQEL